MVHQGYPHAGQGVFLEDLIGEGNVALTMGVTMLGSLEEPSEAEGMLAKMMMDAMEEYIEEHVSNEKKERVSSEPVTAQRIYALLYKLNADVARLDTMLRTVKKILEERERT